MFFELVEKAKAKCFRIKSAIHNCCFTEQKDPGLWEYLHPFIIIFFSFSRFFDFSANFVSGITFAYTSRWKIRTDSDR